MSEFDYLMNEINKMPHLYHLRISSHDGTYEANCKITFNSMNSAYLDGQSLILIFRVAF